MDGINFSTSGLPPGFRFHPTDQELIVHYLKKKISSSHIEFSIIADVDIYKFNPWELPRMAYFGENEFFFFSPRDRKYPNGVRPNRAAGSGYWKATGTDKPIIASSGSCLGVKKALVFYKGRPPKGMKTDWIMYEYRLINTTPRTQKHQGSMRLDDWVLCRVRQKSNMTVGEKAQQSLESQSIGNQYSEKQPGYNNFYEENDRQLLDYLMVPHHQETNSDVSSSKNLYFQGPNRTAPMSNMVSLGLSGEEDTYTPLPFSVLNALDSIKRTLSLGAIDDQSLLPPSKRLYTCDSGDEQSFISSTSFHQPF